MTRFSLTEYLHSIEVTEPTRIGPMLMFGIQRAQAGTLDYLTLDEAMAAQTLEIREVSEQGVVGQVLVVNADERPVFIMAGERIAGAKQDRVINASIMLAGHTKTVIDVSCVEAGRWSHSGKKFAAGPTMAHARLRRRMSPDISEGFRKYGHPVSDQRAVWNEIDVKLQKMRALSASRALAKAYESHAAQLDAMEHSARLANDWTGIVVTVGRYVAAADLFDQSRTLQRLWKKLLLSAAIDAMEDGWDRESITREELSGWLRSAAKSEREKYPSLGLGYDVRLTGRSLNGACLVVENEPVHVTLAPKNDQG